MNGIVHQFLMNNQVFPPLQSAMECQTDLGNGTKKVRIGCFVSDLARYEAGRKRQTAMTGKSRDCTAESYLLDRSICLREHRLSSFFSLST